MTLEYLLLQGWPIYDFDAASIRPFKVSYLYIEQSQPLDVTANQEAPYKVHMEYKQD